MAGSTAQRRSEAQPPWEEDGQANQHEAEFSRLRAALGLQRNNDHNDFKYGDGLVALAADKPTGLKRQGNTDITSMELVVHRDRSGAIALVEMVVARFCTSLLARVPPNDFHMAIWYGARVKRYRRGGWAAMSEEELGHVRYDIQSMIHPCVSMNGDLAWGNHDHAGHASCFSSNSLIFIFSNKDAAMRDLRSLGCDLEKDFWTRDIYDLRELNITYLHRRDLHGRAPTTGGKPTLIPRSKEFSTLDEIMRSRGLISSRGGTGDPAKKILRAAARMAVDDATTAGWWRSKEQLDGGLLHQLPAFGTADEADMFLLELDLARAGPSSKQTLEFTLEHEKTRFQKLPEGMRIAFSANRAQHHGFTRFLNGLPEYTNVKPQTAQIIKLLRLANQEVRVRSRIPPSTNYTYQTPVATMPGKIGMPNTSDSDESDSDEPEEDNGLPPRLEKVVHDYSKAGRDISTRLVDFLEELMPSMLADDSDQIYRLYSTEEHIEDGVSTKYPKMKTNSAFEEVAISATEWGWTMNDEVAGWFITAITGRRELRNWYDSLPSDDSRLEENEKHEAWLQTMIEVVVILVGHQFRSRILN